MKNRVFWGVFCLKYVLKYCVGVLYRNSKVSELQESHSDLQFL